MLINAILTLELIVPLVVTTTRMIKVAHNVHTRIPNDANSFSYFSLNAFIQILCYAIIIKIHDNDLDYIQSFVEANKAHLHIHS